MDTVVLARALFGVSMAFHIIFATLGVGLPLMILIAEILYQRKKDKDFAIMAKRWTRGFGILLGVGIPSGSIVGVMLSLLFPGFMEIVGQVIALPFQIEIWAFFLEALFMSIYVYAADRLSAPIRIMSLFLVALGAVASAVLITDAQAWMNTPTGFRIVNGRITDVHPWEAFFNPAFFTLATHVAVSAYVAGAFATASVAAYKLLTRKRTERELAYHRKGLMLSVIIGGVFAVLTAVNGHATMQRVYETNPEKLAAAEALFQTQTHAPLTIMGVPDPESGTVRWGIEIPGLLSFLSTNRFDGVVRGLNEWPRDEWPPLYSHTLFDTMVGVGTLLILIAVLAVYYRYVRKRELPRWLLWVIAASGFLSLIAIETGWIFSCSGRQPWTIYRIQRTVEATTKTADVGSLFFLFVGLYLLLAVLTTLVMLHYFRRNPVSKEWQKASR